MISPFSNEPFNDRDATLKKLMNAEIVKKEKNHKRVQEI